MHYDPPPSYDMRPCTLKEVRALCLKYHGYKSVGSNATYAFAVYENRKPVAVYVWQPPPPGAAKSVCPECPEGVLALSRMVAVPKEQRQLRHISKPLRRQMRMLIDRTRWPVLITYSDESMGHTGHVYKCSGWEKTRVSLRPTFIDKNGARVSSYSNGHHDTSELTRNGTVRMQRWEHWICERGKAALHMQENGWVKIKIRGKTWRSGNPAYMYANFNQ